MRAMSGLGLEDGGVGGGDLDMMPMMQGMLKSLLSKEVLYPSLKEISTKVSPILLINIYEIKENGCLIEAVK